MEFKEQSRKPEQAQTSNRMQDSKSSINFRTTSFRGIQ